MNRAFKRIIIYLLATIYLIPSNAMASNIMPRYIGEEEGMNITQVLQGTIDVYNINRRGQLVYDDIIIVNTSALEVNVILRKVRNDKQSTISLRQNNINPSSTKKEVYMYLENTSNRYEERYTIAENIQWQNLGTLAPGEKMVLAIDGEANTNCYTWHQADVLKTTMEFIFERVEWKIEEVQDVKPEMIPEGEAEVVTDELPGENLENTPDEIPGENLEDTSDEIPGENLENTPDEIPGENLEDTPDEIPRENLEDTPDKIL